MFGVSAREVEGQCTHAAVEGSAKWLAMATALLPLWCFTLARGMGHREQRVGAGPRVLRGRGTERVICRFTRRLITG